MATANITEVATWIQVCKRLGKTAVSVDDAKINKWTEAQWERRLNGLLGGGGAAVLRRGEGLCREPSRTSRQLQRRTIAASCDRH
jgi:hypothetical protein